MAIGGFVQKKYCNYPLMALLNLNIKKYVLNRAYEMGDSSSGRAMPGTTRFTRAVSSTCPACVRPDVPNGPPSQFVSSNPISRVPVSGHARRQRCLEGAIFDDPGKKTPVTKKNCNKNSDREYNSPNGEGSRGGTICLRADSSPASGGVSLAEAVMKTTSANFAFHSLGSMEFTWSWLGKGNKQKERDSSDDDKNPKHRCCS